MDTLSSPFYRVTTRALIFDEQNRLLVFRNRQGIWEIPGGGLEHDESVQACLEREIYEEIGACVATIGNVVAFWRSKNNNYGYMQLRLGVRVELDSCDFTPGGEAAEVRFVTKHELLELPLELWEDGIKEQVDLIWGEQ